MGQAKREGSVVKSAYIPDRGDCVWVNFDPVSGHEQKGRRPAFVVSPKNYNEKSGLALVCPITSKIKGYPFEAVCKGRKIIGAVLADQLKSIDWRSRKIIFIERAREETTREIQEKIGLLISG